MTGSQISLSSIKYNHTYGWIESESRGIKTAHRPQYPELHAWELFTDGSCIGNPGPGGWAVVEISPTHNIIEISGSEPDTTNNRMEIRAVIEALGGIPYGDKCTIYTDSLLVVNTMTQGWRRRVNNDLWDQLDQLYLPYRDKVTFTWVRGHSGDLMNERADKLANKEARSIA